MTLLEIVQEFCRRQGLPVPSAVVSLGDDQLTQIVGLANELTAERAVRFACFPALCGFYAQLGFLQIGKIQHYTTDWNTT